MSTQIRAIQTFIALLLTMAGLSVSAPTALAGEFPVKQCDGAAQNGFFGEYGQLNTFDHVDVVSGCHPGGTSKVGVYQDRSGSRIPFGTGGQFMWAPNTGIRIVGTTITAKVNDVNGVHASVFGVNLDTGPIDLYGGQPHDGQLRTTRWSEGGPVPDLVVARLACSRQDGCDNASGGPKAYFELFDLEILSRDFLPPSLTASGDLPALGDSGTWVSGERTFSVGASDFGAGIHRAFLEVNAFEVDLPAVDCPDDRSGYATSFSPCPTNLDRSGSADTSSLPFREGSNSFRLCVEDFAVPASAANRSCTAARTLLVDNEPSAQPAGLEVLGGSAWRAINGFEFSWQIPSGQSSPVVATEYRLIDTADEQEVDRGQVTGTGPTAAGPLPVPAPGTYRAEFRLIDAAGNIGAPASVLVRFDDSPPGDVAPEEPDGWISADELPLTQPIERAAAGGPSGVEGYGVSVSSEGPTNPCGAAICGPEDLALTGGADDRTALIPGLTEGSHWVSAVAASGARLSSRRPGSTIIQVDKTDPVTVLSGVPGTWVDHPVTVTATAHDELSGMEADPGNDDGLPLTVIAPEGQAPYEAPGPTASFTLATEGVTRIQYWARDLAGNLNDGRVGVTGDRHRAPESDVVRIDTVPPDLAFLENDPADPELVSAEVSDSSSGFDHGRISIRRLGAGSFSPLQTAVDGDGLIARVPSDDLAPGNYELRAEAYDRAGNVGSTVSRTSGSAMLLSLPLKRPVALTLSHAGRRLKVRRVVTASGKKAFLTGRVSYLHGGGLSGAQLVIEQRFASGSRRRVVSHPAIADGTGRFRVRLSPGPNRSVQVLYAGSRLNTRATSRKLIVVYRDRILLRLSRRTLRNGGRLLMKGSIYGPGAILPSGGKLVAIQYFDPGRTRWRPVEVLRAGRSGRFRYSYRFRTIASAQRIMFRAVSLPEAGWPYAGSTSAPKSVIVYPAGS